MAGQRNHGGLSMAEKLIEGAHHTCGKRGIVRENYTAGTHAGPEPLKRSKCAFIEVQIEMNKSESKCLQPGSANREKAGVVFRPITPLRQIVLDLFKGFGPRTFLELILRTRQAFKCVEQMDALRRGRQHDGGSGALVYASLRKVAGNLLASLNDVKDFCALKRRRATCYLNSGSPPSGLAQWVAIVGKTEAEPRGCAVNAELNAFCERGGHTRTAYAIMGLLLLVFAAATAAQSALGQTQFSMSTTASSLDPSPAPGIVRICCYAGWAGLEPSRGSYNFTAKVNPWKAQAARLGAQFLMTFLEVPTWANGTGSPGNTYTHPTDISTVATCQNVLSGVRTTDCQWKEMITAYMQYDCGVSAQPGSPLTSTCGTKYFEIWNEFNVARYAGNFTAAQLAIMANDAAAIVRLYCGDCRIIGGSVSAGGDGSNYMGMSGVYYTAMLSFLQAWGAISGHSLPDIISVHTYPARTNVSPVPFPETIQSVSSSLCTGAPNQYCRIAVNNEAAYLRTNVLCDASIAAWACSLKVASTEGGWGEIKSICDGATSTATCSTTDPTHGANVITLRRAYTSRWALAQWSQQMLFSLLYEYGTDACWMPMYSPSSGAYMLDNSACTGNATLPTSGALPWLQAYSQTITWLNSATFVSAESGTAACSGKIWTMPIKISGANATFAWYDGNLSSCSYSTTYTSAQMLDGTTTAVSSTVTLTNEPMLLTTPSTPPPPPAVKALVAIVGIG